MKYAVAALIVLAGLIYTNNSHVDRTAKDFVTEQLAKHNIHDWASMNTAVPTFALFLSSYDVMVEVRKNGRAEFVPTRITGTCLSNCVIELSSFEFLRLL